MSGKVYVVDERFSETYNMSSKEIKEWLDFDIPNWCNEIRFNDNGAFQQKCKIKRMLKSTLLIFLLKKQIKIFILKHLMLRFIYLTKLL
jgi:hypothetical protein